MTEARRGRRGPDGTRVGGAGRVDAGPGALEPVDLAVFPDRATRRAIDGGASSARWQALLDEGGPILADGAMGTMLFAAGLQFGDPPEVWNLDPAGRRPAHPPRLPRRRLADPADQHVRRQPRCASGSTTSRVGSPRSTRRPRCCSGPRSRRPAGGRSWPATSGRRGAIMAPLGTLDHDEAVDVFAEQAAALVAGGVDLIWIETMSDLAEITAAIEGRPARRAADIPIIATMTFDTRGHTMMGVSPEQAVAALVGLGRRRRRRQLRQRARTSWCRSSSGCAPPRRMRPRRQVQRRACRSWSTCGPSTAPSRRRWPPQACAMHAAGARIIGGCCGSTPEHLRAMRASLLAAAADA